MLPGVSTNKGSSIEGQQNPMNWALLGAFVLFGLVTASGQGGVGDTIASLD
jgi:hypothetical protein